jgi:cellulose synthase/poly-beta-1,6-N-acetylglucosamine synthase-like glycosyltransferase
MKVSVVVPVRNDAVRLERLLASLRMQVLPETIGGIEIMVVDNGSNDGSVAVGRRLADGVLVEPGIRVGALRNRGVQATRGEVIAFADSDHEVPVDWVANGVVSLMGAHRIAAVGAHYLPPPSGTWVQRVWGLHRLRGSKEIASVDWLGAGNLFVKREDFDQVGGFREDLVAAEDVDLCHRLREVGKEVLCDTSIRSVHHGEPKTVLAFFRKEYWRGSSGVHAWISQGFPMRDLPSLVWPVWHLLVGAGVVAAALASMLGWSGAGWSGVGVAISLWVLPSILLSLKTCFSERCLWAIVPLATLYFVYGLSRAAALFK